MKKKKRLSMLFFVLAGLAVLISACRPAEIDVQEIKIGVLAPLTGELSAVGEATINAAAIAVDEVNERGGLEVAGKRYPVVLVIEDNEDKEQIAVAAAQKLINQDRVVAIVGPQASRNAIPVSNIAEKAKIPMISPWSTNPVTTEGKEYVFRVAFIDSFQGQVMARFTFEELGATKVAVLYDIASDYNKGIAEIYKDVIEKAGGEVVAFESYTTGETNFTEQLVRIRESGAEVLFLPNYDNEVFLQARQARGAGITAALIGSDSWGVIAPENRAALEGSFFSTHYAPDVASDAAQNFIDAYQEEYQDVPNDVAALTYDAFGLLFHAIQMQGSATPEAIRAGLAATEAFSGVTGTMEYRGTGDPIKSAVILKVENGKFVFYKEANP